MNRKAINNFSRGIVQLLVDGQYEELERLSGGQRLSAEHIEEAISQYDATFVTPPDAAFDEIDIIEVEDSDPKRYSVYFNLFSIEEGRSDLRLQMTLIESGDTFNVKIDNIRVM